MIKRILAWCVILAAVAMLLWFTFWCWENARPVAFVLIGIIAGGLLAFTLSIDDFVITFFVTGPGADTLPLKIYSMIKHSRQMPVINSLSTLMLVFTCLLVGVSRFVANHKPARHQLRK